LTDDVWIPHWNYYLELFVDVTLLVNVFFTFATALKTPDGWEGKPRAIALAYFKSFYFYADILSTVPCLITMYRQETFIFAFYYLRVLRLYYIDRVSETITRYIGKLKGITLCGLKSTQSHSFDVFTRLFIILAYLMSILHVLTCLWIWIGNASYRFD